jgi:hypothetical protein
MFALMKRNSRPPSRHTREFQEEFYPSAGPEIMLPEPTIRPKSRRSEKRREDPPPPSEPSDSDHGSPIPWRSRRTRASKPSRAPTNNNIKVAAPDFYDGRAETLSEWFRQVENYFLLQSDKFREDQSKIIFALSYIRGGKAGEWARHVNEQYLAYLNREDYVIEDLISTWADLKELMKERFGDRFEKETARDTLKTLKQTGQIITYVQEFYLHQKKAKLPNDQLCQYFVRGLSSKIWEMIRIQKLPMENIRKLIDMAEEAEKNIHIREHVERPQRGFYTPHNQSTNTSKPSQYTQPKSSLHRYQTPQHQARRPPPPPPQTQRQKPTGWGKPMDVDKIRPRQNGKVQCYKCRGFGHIAKDCLFTSAHWKKCRAYHPTDRPVLPL